MHERDAVVARRNNERANRRDTPGGVRPASIRARRMERNGRRRARRGRAPSPASRPRRARSARARRTCAPAKSPSRAGANRPSPIRESPLYGKGAHTPINP
ncbi:hypothetical protein E4F39_27910 [Burkholderia pseudomallei]|nr:hypothetical protein [Burkholderia pseudomallei]MPT69711.1 hypothetical protein [Burkholderia pseudomallei]MPT74637.1 hypothetical protein [Burkholderia pseudomallei]MPT86600.1 hypothetical protein [Burkholderia pseudomallei]MPT88847.1 hypothetical protein [Burkholderia pseudomallei]